MTSLASFSPARGVEIVWELRLTCPLENSTWSLLPATGQQEPGLKTVFVFSKSHKPLFCLPKGFKIFRFPGKPTINPL